MVADVEYFSRLAVGGSPIRLRVHSIARATIINWLQAETANREKGAV